MARNPQSSIFAVMTCVYAGYVLLGTFYPFEFSWNFQQPIREGFPEFLSRPGVIDLIQNFLLFIPFGALLCFWLAPERERPLAVLLATLIGVLFSSVIELLQFLFSRTPSVFDILSNAFGTTFGALTAALLPRRLIALGSGLLTKSGALTIMLVAVASYSAIPLVSSMVQWLGPFRIWNPQFSFQIGNEATLNRPWLGKVHLVAVYKRALSQDEIAEHFHQGFAAAAVERRSKQGLIALYAFREGQGDVAHDTSGIEPSLDLVTLRENHVRWLEPGGIEIVRPAILRSRRAGTKLVEALSKADELSVEMWLTPQNTHQEGPARIVSLSRDTGARNFTVGQQGANIQFRLRTPATGRNGAPLALTTASDLLTADTFHIVATYKDGVQRIYANGAEQERLDLTKNGIIGFGTRNTSLAQLAYAFFYFYPLSFLLAAFGSRRSTNAAIALVLPVGTAAGLLAITEVFQAFAFNRAVNLPLLLFGLAVAVLGSMTGGMRSNVEPVGSSLRPALSFTQDR